MARIILSEHGLLKHNFYKLKQQLSIGSASGNQVQLDFGEVCAHHAEIRAQQDEKGRVYFVLQDLGSRHGSYINARRIKTQRLNHNDRIRIGRQQFIFYDHRDRIHSLTNEKFTE